MLVARQLAGGERCYRQQKDEGGDIQSALRALGGPDQLEHGAASEQQGKREA